MNEYVSVYTRKEAIEDGVLLRLEDYFRQEGIDVEETVAKIRWTPGKFVMGELVITAGVAKALPASSVIDALIRHQVGDWGDLDEEDCELNEQAAEGGGRVFSAYWVDAKGNEVEEVRIYVITEWNREATTVLLPEEY